MRATLIAVLWPDNNCSSLSFILTVLCALHRTLPLCPAWPVCSTPITSTDLIVSRALRTVDRSQDLGLRMLKQPTNKQMDFYYSKLLGKDWQQQLEQVRVGWAGVLWEGVGRVCVGCVLVCVGGCVGRVDVGCAAV